MKKEFLFKGREKEYSKEYQDKNRDRLKLQKREYYLKNKDSWKVWNNSIKHKQQRKKHYEQNQERLLDYSKNYREENREEINKKARERTKINPNKVRGINRRSYYNNKTKQNKHRNEHFKERRKIDKDFLIKGRLRLKLIKTLNKYIKTGKITNSKDYGIDFDKIIEHLKPFPENISNYDIHHIKPLFTFNFVNSDGSTDLEEIQKAFSPENHKLLTIKEHKKINHLELKNGS